MTEYIVQIEDSEKNMSERFVGQLRSYPELVRCEDCKYWREGVFSTRSNDGTQGSEEWHSWCEILYGSDDIGSRADDYCSKAERKPE